MISNECRDFVLQNSGVYYLYDLASVKKQIALAQSIQAPYGTTVRYAMKANPIPEVMKLMLEQGVWIDACSEYEAKSAIDFGFDPSKVQLSAQQLPLDLASTVNLGIDFVATSLHQLESYGKCFPNTKVGIRVNPGFGDGQFAKVNVGGKESGFGIRREYFEEIIQIADRYQLTIHKIHTHIGSGTNPDIWADVATLSLQICNHFPQAQILNLGGGFKVARMDYESSVDMKIIGDKIASIFENYYKQSGRKMHLEIEPGTFMIANAGYIACDVIDLLDTGKGGYHFVRLNTGMDMIVRPTMYGSQHPIVVIGENKKNEDNKEYVFIGHCCESSDLLTPSKDNPNALYPRHLNIEPNIGDRVVIGGCGAYCQSMSMKGYNGRPVADYKILA